MVGLAGFAPPGRAILPSCHFLYFGYHGARENQIIQAAVSIETIRA
jgi:hypothetical protein